MRKLRITLVYLRNHLEEVLGAVRQEDIPRIICASADDKAELAALVNAASLDRLIQVAEQAAEMGREPVREQYASHLAQWRGERRALLQQLERLAQDIAKEACPACARRIKERWAGDKPTLGEAWRSVLRGLGLGEPPAGDGEAVISSTVVVGGEGENRDEH